MADTLTPATTSIWPEYCGGTLLVFEISDAQALTLINASLLPKAAPGCKRKWRENGNLITTYRMPDGHVRLTISERLVRQRDNSFQRFMLKAMAANGPQASDTGLSV